MSIADRYRPHYTYEEYCLWEGKWELIKGMPYALSPSELPKHQRTIVVLMRRFEDELSGFGNCVIYPSINWKIEDDTVVRPDAMIVSQLINKDFLDFPSALIVEILSPSSALKDRREKIELYQAQQVMYYLIADPDAKTIEINQIINGKYQLVALNPTNFLFSLDDNCSADVNLSSIWA